MMKTSGHSGTVFTRLLRPLIVGVCVGVIVCTLLLMLMASMVGAVDVPQQAILPLSMTAAALATLLAGLIAARLAGKNGLLLGLCCGLLLFLIVLIAGFVRYTGVTVATAAAKLAILLVAGGLGGILGVSRRPR